MKSIIGKKIGVTNTLKEGDTVIVISGENKDLDRRRKVLEVNSEKAWVVLEGVNLNPPKYKGPKRIPLGVFRGESPIALSDIKIWGELSSEDVHKRKIQNLIRPLVGRVTKGVHKFGRKKVQKIVVNTKENAIVDLVIIDEKLPSISSEDIMTKDFDEKKRKSEITLLEILLHEGFKAAQSTAIGEEKDFITQYKSTPKTEIERKIEELENM